MNDEEEKSNQMNPESNPTHESNVSKELECPLIILKAIGYDNK